MAINGLSIFQGNICTDDQRQEEEEEEEARIRNEELKVILTNAFDDFDNEGFNDDSSVNTSYHQNKKEDDRFKNDYSELQNNQFNFQNGYSTNTPQILTPTDDAHLGSNNYIDNMIERLSSESNLEANFFNYPCNYQTPASHFSNDRNFLRKNFNNQDNDVHKTMDNNKKLSNSELIYSEHTNGHENFIENNSSNNVYKNSEFRSIEQLEVLYQVKLREIESLTRDLNQLQLEKEEAINNLERKLALTQAEVEKSNISRNQLQNALVDAKAEISDLKSQITLLNESNSMLEKTKDKAIEELTVARNSIMEMQQKMSVLEKVQTMQMNDKIQDKFLQQTQEKHNTEMRNMQTQIDVLTNKLQAKDNSYTLLEQKYNDALRANETLIIEKGESINKLAQALEESQKQCHNLMSNNNTDQIQKLEKKLRSALKEKDEILNKYHEIEHKFKLAKSDAYFNFLVNNKSESGIDEVIESKCNNSPTSNKQPAEDVTNKLHIELQRCLDGQAIKRKEINRLENIIRQKDKELQDASNHIKDLIKDSNHSSKKIEQLEQELKTLLTDQAKKANDQIQKLANHLKQVNEKYNELKNEKNLLENQLKLTHETQKQSIPQFQDSDQEIKNHSLIIKSNHVANNVTAINNDTDHSELPNKYVDIYKDDKELIELKIQLEQTQKELDQVKELYIDVCDSKARLINEHLEELNNLKEKYENSNSDLNSKLNHELITKNKNLLKECENQKNEIDKLEKLLFNERKKVDDLNEKINFEINKAKEAAINELRNLNINSTQSTDNCLEHLKKISQLEENCKNLYEIVQANEKKLIISSNLTTQLDNVKDLIVEIENMDKSLKSEVTRIFYELNKSLPREKTMQVSDSIKIKQLENDLKKVYDERNMLYLKFKNQTKLFEKSIKDQKANNLNISLNETSDSEIMKSAIKQVRKEMEQKVADELKNMENQYQEEIKLSQKKMQDMIIELKRKLDDKNNEFDSFKELVYAEKLKSHSSLRAQEQIVAKLIETRLKYYHKELLDKKLQIEKLESLIQEKHHEIEEERNFMAQLISEWAEEMKEIKQKNVKLEQDMILLNTVKEKCECEVQTLKETKKKMEDEIINMKKKCQSLKKVATEYKEYTKRKEEFLYRQYKKNEEDYKKSLLGIEKKVEKIVNVQREEIAQQIQEIRNKYDERLNKIYSKNKKFSDSKK